MSENMTEKKCSRKRKHYNMENSPCLICRGVESHNTIVHGLWHINHSEREICEALVERTRQIFESLIPSIYMNHIKKKCGCHKFGECASAIALELIEQKKHWVKN